MVSRDSLDRRYVHVIDNVGEIHEVAPGDPLWLEFADSQVSSSWMACAYRYFKDPPSSSQEIIALDDAGVMEGGGDLLTTCPSSSCNSPKENDSADSKNTESTDGTTTLSSEGRLRSRSPKRQNVSQ